MAEGGDRAAVSVGRQSIDRGALQQEWHDFRFVENTRHQLAVFQVIGGKRGLIFGETAVNFVHSVPWVVDSFAFAQ